MFQWFFFFLFFLCIVLHIFFFCFPFFGLLNFPLSFTVSFFVLYLLRVDISNAFPFIQKKPLSWFCEAIQIRGHIGTWTYFWLLLSYCTYFAVVLSFHCKYHLTHKHARAHTDKEKKDPERELRLFVCPPASYFWPEQIRF